MLAPGKVNAYTIMIAIITKSKGMSILEAFPIPLSISLFEINHMISQTTNTAIVVGIKKKPASLILELPPTCVKKLATSVPQSKLKLPTR